MTSTGINVITMSGSSNSLLERGPLSGFLEFFDAYRIVLILGLSLLIRG